MPGYRSGPQCGLRGRHVLLAEAGAAGVKRGAHLFFAGDCPFVAAEVYEEMLHTEGDMVEYGISRPSRASCLFSRRAVDELLEDAQCHTLKAFIDGKRPVIVAVDCPGILWDIDTPEDYAQAQKYVEGQGKG